MVLSYRTVYGPSGIRHAAVGGSYSALLTVGTGSITVGAILQGTNVPALQRPAGATEQLAREAASAALTACAAATVVSPLDCPQSPFLPEARRRMSAGIWSGTLWLRPPSASMATRP